MFSYEFIFKADQSFDGRCLQVFRYQAEHSTVFRTFLESFNLNSKSDVDINEIPLLPIEAFKYRPIIIDELNAKLRFMSSGTSSMNRSTHHIFNENIYKEAIRTEFYRHFPMSDYSILFHMPGYENNHNSSLIWMADYLIECDQSGFSRYLPEIEQDIENHIREIEKIGKKVVLFGAAFGILDLIDSREINFPKSLEVIETGGMKTYRREISKQDLREKISNGFDIPLNQIHSEYGMCELLSQCYAVGSEMFQSPHWVDVSIRKDHNPNVICEIGEEGKIGIIDLANLYSCSFILTEDRGLILEDGGFQVLGRWHPENLRGCNFLIDS